jgi:hypothetical protein
MHLQLFVHFAPFTSIDNQEFTVNMLLIPQLYALFYSHMPE